jgi:hypothetical protein
MSPLDRPIRMFLCPAPQGIAVIDVGLTIEIDLRGGGVEAHLARTLRPICPTAEATFCRRICSG